MNSITDNFTMFDDNFLSQFKDSGFYAKPKKTKLYFNTNNSRVVIGNCIVANLEITNEKIPVYSYNADIYKKYLNGKKIITGALALRKTTVTNFIALIKRNSESAEVKNQIEIIDEQIAELNKIDKEKNLIAELIKELENEKSELISQNTSLISGDKYAIKESDMNLDLLYYNEVNESNNGMSLDIRYEGDGVDQINCLIKDILFVKKNTEINVGKTDIVEVYQFIGNPSN